MTDDKSPIKDKTLDVITAAIMLSAAFVVVAIIVRIGWWIWP